MASYVDLIIDQGTTFNKIIYLTNEVTNTPMNISGYSVSSQMRRSYYSLNITSNITCTASNTVNGEVTMSMTSGQTANIAAGRYVFDVVVRNTSNVVTRFLEGMITITPSVTR